MKEMPKEIWLHHVTTPSAIGTTWLERKVWDNDVEYVHKDAFIERAIGWIDYNNRNDGCNFNGWEKDFKTYMKGE